MSRARTLWKWTAATLAVLLVAAAATVGALRVWLEQSTTVAPAIVARLERASGLKLQFTKLDARLGLYGPELVFRDARLYAPGETAPLAVARAGRVGVDWWRMLRTGRLAAGRVILDGARLGVLVTPRGAELRHQGPLWRDEDQPTRLDRLPVGHVEIVDAELEVEDARTGAGPYLLEDVQLVLERNPSHLTATGRAKLPRALGAKLSVAMTLDGDLAHPAETAWDAGLDLAGADLAGWRRLVPAGIRLPAAGHGDLKASARGRGPTLAVGSARLALADVKLPPAAPGVAPVVYRTLAGDVAVTHAGGTWSVGARGLDLATDAAAWRHGRLDGELSLDGGALARARLATPALELAALAPFAALLPDSTAREALLALAPRGRLADVDLALARGTGAAEWRVDGNARFAGLGIGPWQAIPGFGGVDGDLAGRGTEGRVAIRSRGFTLALTRFLPAPVGAKELAATFDWSWRPDGWRVASRDLRAVAPDGHGTGQAQWWLPADGSGPRLDLDLDVADLDAKGAVKYLPTLKFGRPVTAWLERAFLGGRVASAKLGYHGEMRRFPFHDGGGEFRVAAVLDGLKVHYQDGWADADGVSGEAQFVNDGFTARIAAARVAGVALSGIDAGIERYGDAVLTVRANARGDVRDGLGFVQRSPIGPRLGRWFMGVTGHGPFEAKVALELPFKRIADRVVDLDARLERVTAKLPGLDDEVRDLAGSFRLRNRDVDVPGITGTFLGGPFRGRAATADGARGERVLTAQAEGRALGARLQPLVGFAPAGPWLDGTLDWTASARIPRLEWRPRPPAAAAGADAPPPETEVRWLPMTIRGDSTLLGLVSRFPAPLAKAPDETRAFHAEVTIDPGVDPAAPVPPRALRAREAPRPTTILARAQAGHDAAVLAWREDATWAFDRGTVRFGGGTPVLRDGRGVWVDGRIPEFDLSAWLKVDPSAGAPAPATGTGTGGVSSVLRGGAVQVDRFAVLGFSFPDVALTLEGRDRAWRAQVDGPLARGAIVVPFDFRRGEPLSLDMDRLVLGERTAGTGGGGGGAEAPTDPREMPALKIEVRTLEYLKRKFGSLSARISRTPDGLKLEGGTLTGATFVVRGTGSWTANAQGSATRVVMDAKSSDVLETLNAWGFAPTLSGKSGAATADLGWSGGPEGDVLARLSGKAHVAIEDGQLLNVQPGAGRVLGLMSVGALPRRLTLDFTDLTDKGFAYDSITGDFEFRDGNAHTANLLLKGPAAEIGIVGRTGLAAHDYDQTAVVTGHFGGPIAAAGALAGGPAVGAALLLFSKVFKESLSGIARGYYRITGSWDKPKVERIGAGAAREAESVAGGSAPPEAAAPAGPPR